jgi:hypothetical protein
LKLPPTCKESLVKPRRTAVAGVALGLTAGLLAGCGGGSSSGSPAGPGQLSSAVDALGNASTLTATIHLGGSSAQAAAFIKKAKSGVSAAQAKQLAGATVSLELTAPSGKSIADTSTSDLAERISGMVGGRSVLDARVVNGTLYAQAEFKGLLNAFGQASTYRQIEASFGQLPTAGQALFRGKWVSLAFGSLGVGAGGSAKGSAVIDELKTVLTKDLTVKQSGSGSYTLTGNAKTIATDLMSSVSTANPLVGMAAGQTSLSKLPNKMVTVTATTTGGKLSQVSMDLTQFASPGTSGPIPLDVDIATSGPAISAPTGATTFDLTAIGAVLKALGISSPIG